MLFGTIAGYQESEHGGRFQDTISGSQKGVASFAMYQPTRKTDTKIWNFRIV